MVEPTVLPPLIRSIVTSPVLPDEVNTAEALLPLTAASLTVPMAASLTVKTASAGSAFAGAPEKSMALAVSSTEEAGV